MSKYSLGKDFSLHLNDLPADFGFTSSVAVDTEAMGLINKRDRLCLVQLCTQEGKIYLVQFNGQDYSAPNLKRLLLDQRTLKIFHFARFDVAILKYYLEVYTQPIYCTKIASFLSRTYTDKHSLKELCNELLNVKLDKHQQSSDWGASDLSKQQIDYAISDVVYLNQIKERLNILLQREKREALAEECFKFLRYRIELDLRGWENVDIFSHKVNHDG